MHKRDISNSSNLRQEHKRMSTEDIETAQRIEKEVADLYRRTQKIKDPRFMEVRHKILEVSIVLFGLRLSEHL